MDRQALGLIETLGMIPAVEAADNCVKSANVKLIGYELATGGFVTVKVEGNVGAVNSAIDAAKASASRVGTVISTLVIPRPSKGISYIVESNFTKGIQKQDIAEEVKNKKENIEDEIDKDEKKPLESEESVFQENSFNKQMKFPDKYKGKGEKKSDICNLCYDPKCTRKKGQPKDLCIHYKTKKVNSSKDDK